MKLNKSLQMPASSYFSYIPYIPYKDIYKDEEYEKVSIDRLLVIILKTWLRVSLAHGILFHE